MGGNGLWMGTESGANWGEWDSREGEGPGVLWGARVVAREGKTGREVRTCEGGVAQCWAQPSLGK